MRETNIDKPLHNIIIIIIIIVQIFKDFFLLKIKNYSLMKKLALLFQFCIISLCGFSQEVKSFSLKDFEGKKIISLFKSTNELKGSFPGVPLVPTNQYHTVNRSISFQKKENNILAQKTIYKVNIDVENMVTMDHREFDTDRKFDRTMEQSMVYGKYDNFVSKPFVMVYSNQNKRIDTLTNFKENNFYFDMAWGDNSLPFLQEDWIGIFQISLPKENWKVGQTWQQIIHRKQGMATKNELITNTYTVKSISNDVIILDFKGVNIPEQVIYKRSDGFVKNMVKDSSVVSKNDKINYTVKQQMDSEGIIRLDAKDNLVIKMEISTVGFKKIDIKDSPSSGPETTYKVTIENTLEDLK